MTKHLIVLACVVGAVACHHEQPVVRPQPAPPPTAETRPVPRPPAPPQPVNEPVVVPAEPVRDDAIASGSLDDLNRNSPLRPVFYDYDSADLTAEAQGILKENLALLNKYATWAVTIEGHCDER